MTYFNTNKESGATLAASKTKAKGQEGKILAYFREHPGRRFSPSQIQKEVLPNAPLTSIRRAITVLTEKRSKLEKTNMQVMGIYGKKEYCWTLKTGQGSLFDGTD
jgi:DNA-binding response OmpR family regulator